MTKTTLLALLLCFVGAAGCSNAVDAIFLTPSEAQDLQLNLEASLEVQQRMSEYVFAAARGDVDITGYLYDAPTPANNWVGTIDVPAGTALPFGTGSAQVTFSVMADGVPVDPYATDISSATDVNVDIIDVSFDGVSVAGAPLTADGALTLDTVLNAPDSATTLLNGALTVVHDGYAVALDATDVSLDLDLLLDEVTNVTGTIAGTVDIPNFAFDADFDIDGLGDSVQIGIDVVATTIDYVLDLSDLF